jgi:hypothetical protein
MIESAPQVPMQRSEALSGPNRSTECDHDGLAAMVDHDSGVLAAVLDPIILDDVTAEESTDAGHVVVAHG